MLVKGESQGGFFFAFYGGQRGSGSFADYYRADINAGDPRAALANCWLMARGTGVSSAGMKASPSRATVVLSPYWPNPLRAYPTDYLCS